MFEASEGGRASIEGDVLFLNAEGADRVFSPGV